MLRLGKGLIKDMLRTHYRHVKTNVKDSKTKYSYRVILRRSMADGELRAERAGWRLTKT